jgi:hypothetical protein
MTKTDEVLNEVRRPLTQEQARKVAIAIDRAQGAGSCNYATSLGPECVIGQLAALHGVTERQLLQWDGNVMRVLCDVDVRSDAPGVAVLDEYPAYLLEKLQSTWDNPGVKALLAEGGVDDETVRVELRQVLVTWPKEGA